MTEVVWHPGTVDAGRRSAITGGPGVTVWLTGLSGSGKSTVAHALEDRLVSSGRASYVLDGDNVRHGLNGDLGFSPEDRTENVRRIGEVARLMADAGLVVAVPVISPYRADRARVRASHAAAGIRFVEVWVATPVEVCEERDPKGMYARARAGEITGFTGVDAPYEAPESPDLTLDTSTTTVESCVGQIIPLLA
ncbi:MAG: adenylyl-sulfate kinase [Acidimicrobiia bacterium]